MNKECLKCGETLVAIRRYKMSCGLVQGGELVEEYGRHRFTPYTKKELAFFAEEAKKESDYWDNKAKEEGFL